MAHDICDHDVTGDHEPTTYAVYRAVDSDRYFQVHLCDGCAEGLRADDGYLIIWMASLDDAGLVFSL